MRIQCSFFVRLRLLLHFVGLFVSPFAERVARVASSPPFLDVFRITSPSPFSIPVLVASPLSEAFRFGLPDPTAVRPWPPRLLLFSELRHSVATELRAGSPSRGRHLWARMCLVGAAWVELLKSSVTRRDGSESDSLVPPDTAARVVPCLSPSCQVLVRRSEDRLSRLQHGGLAAAVLTPGLPPRGSGSLHQSPASSPSGCVPGSDGPADRRG
jgi:hypothetical protein